jgi:glycosyltransferase involved in cell wall biosynthesis
MDNKLFSIVTPVYNGEKYLQDTLDSIRRQTFKDFELIVVDGGSSDNTMEIINLNSDLITKTVSEPDNGMYDALEKGFKLATGKYLCYINSDDRLLPHALEFVKSKMKEGKYDLVFGDVNYLSEQGDIVYTHKALLMPKYGVKYMRRLPFAQQSAFWTRDLYNRIGGFDSSLKFVADSEFLLKAYLNPTGK